MWCRWGGLGTVLATLSVVSVLVAACGSSLQAGPSTDDAGNGFDAGGKQPEADRPWGLSASSDDSERVRLRWFAPTSAAPDGYVVLRDGTPLAMLNGALGSYDDTQAEPGTFEADGGSDLTASQGLHSEGVELSWTPLRTRAGAEHSYAVRARYGTRVSAPSAPAVGQRAAPPILRQELCREPCTDASWFPVGLGATFMDMGAPSAELSASSASAVAHVVPEGSVSLSVNEPDATIKQTLYRIRAVSSREVGPASHAVVGYRSVGQLHHQWQRSVAGGSFEDLPDVTGLAWVDANPPLDSEVDYRARISADGAVESVSSSAHVHTVPAISVLALSYESGCVLIAGKLRCWGEHDLRYGMTSTELDPPSKPTLDAIEMNEAFNPNTPYVCGLEHDTHHLRCFRLSSHYQDSDEFVSTSVAYSNVSAGGQSLCAIRADNHDIDCFTLKGLSQPSGLPSGAYAALAVGYSNTCAIRADDHTLACSTGSIKPGRFTQISTDSSVMCALREKDQLALCWDGMAVDLTSSEPLATVSGAGCGLTKADGHLLCWRLLDRNAAVTMPGKHHRAISGAFSICVITEDGRVRCEGINDGGEAPKLPPSAKLDVLSSASRPCGLTADGTVQCWNGLELDQPAGPGYKAVVSTDVNACALQAGGAPICWGPPDSSSDVPADPSVALSALSGGGGGVYCGLRASDGALTCFGALGKQLAPFHDTPYGSGFTQVANGSTHACMLSSLGTLQCVGDKGSAAFPPQPAPDQYTSLSAGAFNTCAIDSIDARVHCWGGSGSRSSPVLSISQVGTRFSSVAAGSDHICAIRELDGKIQCWGDPGLPAGITLSSYKVVTSGYLSTCGVRVEDGRRVCWGFGYVGEQGAPVVQP